MKKYLSIGLFAIALAIATFAVGAKLMFVGLAWIHTFTPHDQVLMRAACMIFTTVTLSSIGIRKWRTSAGFNKPQ